MRTQQTQTKAGNMHKPVQNSKAKESRAHRDVKQQPDRTHLDTLNMAMMTMSRHLGWFSDLQARNSAAVAIRNFSFAWNDCAAGKRRVSMRVSGHDHGVLAP